MSRDTGVPNTVAGDCLTIHTLLTLMWQYLQAVCTSRGDVKTQEAIFILQESLDSMSSSDPEMFLCFSLVVSSTLFETLLFLIS